MRISGTGLLRDACLSCHPSNGVKALRENDDRYFTISEEASNFPISEESSDLPELFVAIRLHYAAIYCLN